MKCNRLISIVFLGVLILAGCDNSGEDIDAVINEEVISEEEVIKQQKLEAYKERIRAEQNKVIQENEVEYRDVTDEELNKILKKAVHFLQAEPNILLNADDSLGLYKEITGYHITENEDHYKLLKEAYWNKMTEDGLCNNIFWKWSNTDCTNKPSEAFARVEAYVQGSGVLASFMKQEEERLRDETLAEKEQQEEQELEKNRGLTYDNFLKVGDADCDTLSKVNELFGFNGKLQTESESYGTLIQSYEWHKGSGANYKSVSIWFVNGRVDSKFQVGL